MRIDEVVKNFLRQPAEVIDTSKDSSSVKDTHVIADLTNSDIYHNTGSFFDDHEAQNGLIGSNAVSSIITRQKNKIMTYRQVALTPDVTEALDEIVNEIIFGYDDKIPLKFDADIENDKLVEAISGKFEKIMRLINVKRNLFQLVKNSYVDGVLILHTAYDKNSTKGGIKSVKMIEPCMLYFDKKTNTYKYMRDDHGTVLSAATDQNKEYSIEEIIREDFGLYDGKINLSYIEYAVKPANILKTLEDLLIPMRFSRSISRRVFNVDIGDLPNKRGQEVMKEMQNKFKYKKFYNNETGEVSNQQHITSMVEDYWFANRAGGRGTQVDVLDESGNLGQMDDILYFARKLYRALKIPSNRIDINPDGDKDFEYDSTRVTKEDMKFFMFISRVRQVYSSAFKELLKREVISTGIMSEAEWDDNEDLISISFTNENKFIEKMKIATLTDQIEAYNSAQEFGGKIFSYQELMKRIFRLSEEQIIDNLKEIKTEKADPLYGNFYGDEESW